LRNKKKKKKKQKLENLNFLFSILDMFFCWFLFPKVNKKINLFIFGEKFDCFFVCFPPTIHFSFLIGSTSFLSNKPNKNKKILKKI
jgi:hypothetical protein